MPSPPRPDELIDMPSQARGFGRPRTTTPPRSCCDAVARSRRPSPPDRSARRLVAVEQTKRRSVHQFGESAISRVGRSGPSPQEMPEVTRSWSPASPPLRGCPAGGKDNGRAGSTVVRRRRGARSPKTGPADPCRRDGSGRAVGLRRKRRRGLHSIARGTRAVARSPARSDQEGKAARCIRMVLARDGLLRCGCCGSAMAVRRAETPGGMRSTRCMFRRSVRPSEQPDVPRRPSQAVTGGRCAGPSAVRGRAASWTTARQLASGA